MSLPSVNLLHTLQNPKTRLEKILKLMVTTTRSNQDHTMMLHTYNPKAKSLPSVNFLPFLVSETRRRFYSSRLLRQGQIKVTPWRCTPTIPNQCPYQVSTSYTLQFLRHSPDKILQVEVTMARSNQGHIMTLHTYTPLPMCLPSINFLYLCSPDKLFPADPRPVHLETMRENNTLTALKGCGVKITNMPRISHNSRKQKGVYSLTNFTKCGELHIHSVITEGLIVIILLSCNLSAHYYYTYL